MARHKADHVAIVSQMLQINPASSLYVGNLSYEVNKELLFEIFIQAGPVAKIKYEKKGYALIDFANLVRRWHATACFTLVITCNSIKAATAYQNTTKYPQESASYAYRLFKGNLVLFNRPVKIEFSHRGPPQ